MLSARLVRMVEDHAEQLSQAVLDEVGSNPLTPSYHSLPREELYRRTYAVFSNLARWLVHETDAVMEAWYGEVGRQRAAESIPLSELIQALTLTRYRLEEYIRSVGLADSALELYQELEIHRLLSRFFDKAIYFAAKGYEGATSAKPAESTATRTR
jgi:hypothetical protein